MFENTGEEGKHRRDDHFRAQPIAEPCQQQRRDGDLGKGLERQDEGVEPAAEDAEIGEQGTHGDGAEAAGEEAQHRLFQGDGDVEEPVAAEHAGGEGVSNLDRRGQDEWGDRVEPDQEGPQAEHQQEGGDEHRRDTGLLAAAWLAAGPERRRGRDGGGGGHASSASNAARVSAIFVK